MKKYIIILVLFGGYLIFALFGTSLISNLTTKYLYIGNTARFQYTNGTWSNIQYKSSDSIYLKQYSVYSTSTGSLTGKYDLEFNNDSWSYRNNNNYEDYTEDMIAYKGSNKFSVIPFDKKQLSATNAKKILTDLGISGYNELTLSYEIDIDYDNDGNTEPIYVLSNVFADGEATQYFSIICTYKDGKYDTLLKNVTSDDLLTSQIQNDIYAIIDLTGDKKYEIITSTDGFSESMETVYTIFGLTNNNYQKIISNS